MQTEVLEKYAGGKLKVFAIWLPIMQGDRLEMVDSTLLIDPRVGRYWDGQRVIGRWFTDNLGGFPIGSAAWDVYYLFGADASWKEVPQPLLATGRPIFHARERLQIEIDLLFSASSDS